MRFSVVIPVYNRAQYMHREALDSVLSQRFKDFELIVVDDGSTDETSSVLESYGSQIRVIRQKNLGAEAARYHGVGEARGEYVVFLDSDDLLFASALETYERIIQECRRPALMIAARVTFRDGESVPEELEGGPIAVAVYQDFLSRNVDMFLSNSVIVIKRSVLEATGKQRRQAAPLVLDDFHMCLNAGTQPSCIVVGRPATVAYREHGSNAHHNHEANLTSILSLVDWERCGGYPGGNARRSDRYVWIGSIGLHWIRRWLSAGNVVYPFRLMLRATPMLIAAATSKVIARCRPSVAVPVNVTEIPSRIGSKENAEGDERRTSSELGRLRTGASGR